MSNLLEKYGITGIKHKHVRQLRKAGISPFTVLPANHADLPQQEVEAHFLAQFDLITETLGITDKFDEVDAEDVPQVRNELLGLLFGTGGGKPGAEQEKNSLPSAPPSQT